MCSSRVLIEFKGSLFRTQESSLFYCAFVECFADCGFSAMCRLNGRCVGVVEVNRF